MAASIQFIPQLSSAETRSRKRKTMASDSTEKTKQVAKKAKMADDTAKSIKRKVSKAPLTTAQKIQLIKAKIRSKEGDTRFDRSWATAAKEVGVDTSKVNALWSNIKKKFRKEGWSISLEKALAYVKKETKPVVRADFDSMSLATRFEIVHRKTKLNEEITAVAKTMGLKYQETHNFYKNGYMKRQQIWDKRFADAKLTFDSVVKARESGVKIQVEGETTESEIEAGAGDKSGDDIEMTPVQPSKREPYKLRSRAKVSYTESGDSEEESEAEGAGAKVQPEEVQSESEEESDEEEPAVKVKSLTNVQKIEMVECFQLLGKNWQSIAFKMRVSEKNVESFFVEYQERKKFWDKVVELKNAKKDKPSKKSKTAPLSQPGDNVKMAPVKDASAGGRPRKN